MFLANADAIREELGLSASDASRVARVLPEASAHLRRLKGDRWYLGVLQQARVARSPVPVEVPAEPGPSYVGASARITLDRPTGGATVALGGTPGVFVAGVVRPGGTEDFDVVERIEARVVSADEARPWMVLYVWGKGGAGSGSGDAERAGDPVGFSGELTAEPGAATVEVRATTRGGLVSRSAAGVLLTADAPALDTSGPDVRIDSPRPGATSPGGRVVVLGRALDASGVGVVRVRETVGGVVGPWTDVADGGGAVSVAWTYEAVRPSGGVVLLDVEARDTLANVTLESLAASVLPAASVPSGPVEVEIEAPRDGALVQGAFAVLGRARYPDGVTGVFARAYAGGSTPGGFVPVAFTSGAQAEQPFAFRPAVTWTGPTVVEVRATAVDLVASAAAESTVEVEGYANLVLDVAAPPAGPAAARVLVIERPSVGAVLVGRTVAVLGRASDPSGVAVVEARLVLPESGPTIWNELSIEAGAAEVAFGAVLQLPGGADYGPAVVEVRATYVDPAPDAGQASTARVVSRAVILTPPAEVLPPSVTILSPPAFGSVQSPGFDLFAAVQAGVGQTVASVSYRFGATGPGAAWRPLQVVPGQRRVEVAAVVSVPEVSTTGFFLVELRAEDGAGRVTTATRTLAVVPRPEVATSEPVPNIEDDGEKGGDGTSPTDVPKELLSEPSPSWLWPVDEKGALVIAAPVAPADVLDAVAEGFTQSGSGRPGSATTFERFVAERAECLLALAYGLGLINLRLGASGGILATTWTRRPDEGTTEQVRFASGDSLEMLRRDLVQSAHDLVDGGVRITYGGRGEATSVDALSGWGGGWLSVV